MKPYDYQERAEAMLWEALNAAPDVVPCLAMPGGSGKSVLVAMAIKTAMQWPGTRVLMVVRSQELVKQNAAQLRRYWPGAPMGVVCSGLGRKDFGEPITIASTGSVARHADKLGHIDLFIIDEAQDMSDDDDSQIRKLVAALKDRNKAMRIFGLSASPYRLSQGMLTDGDNAIFNRILEPVSISELLAKKRLMPLRSKQTTHKMTTEGVGKSGGDFVASQMEKKFDTDDNNERVVLEVMERASAYRHWLVFCSGKEHAAHVSEAFRKHGVTSDHVTSSDRKKDRRQKIADFEAGKIRALCNVGVLTTGYDFPSLDTIVFLRDTMSPGLYLQSAVRGMRLKEHTDHCLVLDFVGVVSRHGPITNITPPKTKGKREGETPMKVCDNCAELCLMFATECPACGAPFPVAEKEKEEKTLVLHDDDIMGWETSLVDLEVKGWRWRTATSRKGLEMIVVSYYGRCLSDKPIVQYLNINSDGYAGTKAWDDVVKIATQVELPPGVLAEGDIAKLCDAMTEAKAPNWIQYTMGGKYPRITRRAWT